MFWNFLSGCGGYARIPMPFYDAVLFDMMGTLIRNPSWRGKIEVVLDTLGRSSSVFEVEGLLQHLRSAHQDSVVLEMMKTEGCSVELHREANMQWFDTAGFDPERAEAFYARDLDPTIRE